MYIVIEKETNDSAIIKDMTELSSFIGVSTKTIQRKTDMKMWKTDRHIIYSPYYVSIKSNRGGNRR